MAALAAATFLTGGIQAGAAAPTPDVAPVAATVTFTTPGQHVYTVPDGVTRVDVLAVGGEGAKSAARRSGRAGRIVGTLDVAPGQTLYAVVGSSASGTTPGENGGGAAGGSAAECINRPGAGGGATDVRTVPIGEPGSAESRVLVAGGGGGSSSLGSGDDDVFQMYGGHRGQGGGDPDLGGWGGGDGVGGKGGAGGETDASSTAGGRGQAGVAGESRGCGGGGGGGYGGGGGGAAGAPTAHGGGGGGGGSLVPGGFPAGMANHGEPPSLTFTTPGLAAPTGPLGITSTVTLKQSNQGGGVCEFCNCPSSCNWLNDYIGPDPGMTGGDFGYFSTQTWGSAGLQDPDFGQESVRVQPSPPGAPAGVGRPFLLANWAHYNYPIRGDSPTSLGIQTVVTVQPPAGPPAVFKMLGAEAVELSFVETANDAAVGQCDPAIQESSRPCDDSWSLPDYKAVTTAGGVTWHFELLGWGRPDTGFARRVSTEETAVTQRDIYAQVTVDTNPTTSTLAVDKTSGIPVLTLTTTPVPQTGGTVSFTDGGDPIPGCTDVPVDAIDGTTTCTPAGLTRGTHTLGGGFGGGIGYAASDAAPIAYSDLQSQTVSFDAPSGLTYGDADVALAATASSGLPVSYSSSTPTVCTTTDAGSLQVLAAGDCTVTASQAGDSTYEPTEQARTFTVHRATLTVTADDKARAYGNANPPLTATTTGFVHGDPASVVSGTPSLSTTATSASPAGGYPINVSVAGLSAANYDFAAVDGTLTVSHDLTTTTTLTATPIPAPLNRAVTLTATVAPSAPGGAAPTGTVTFYLDGSATPLTSAPVLAGNASALALVPGGTHTVIAAYGGDGTYLPSTSTPPTPVSVRCTRTISGRYRGSLVVASGTTCVLPGTRIDGSIVVTLGASLDLEDASIGGGVVAVSPGALRICGSSTGSITVGGATGFVLVGDPGHGCASNKVAGWIIALGNSSGLVVDQNTLGGAVLAWGNQGSGPLPGQSKPVVLGNQR